MLKKIGLKKSDNHFLSKLLFAKPTIANDISIIEFTDCMEKTIISGSLFSHFKKTNAN